MTIIKSNIYLLVTRQLIKDADDALFYAEAYDLRQCSVKLRILTPQQIAALCRPNRPSKTRPRVIQVSNEVNVDTIDHEGLFLIFNVFFSSN